MRQSFHIFTFLTAVMFLILCPSCMERIEGDGIYGDELRFSVSLHSREEGTKVPITTQLSGSAKVLGYPYSGNFAQTTSQWEQLFSASFTFNGDELKSSVPIRWGEVPQGNTNLRLYVFTPAEIPGEGVLLPDNTAKGTPTITYILPQDIEEHTDIIAAVKDLPVTYRNSIPLTFEHALTALKFKVGFSCTVKSVTVSGVSNKAVYTIGEGWSGHAKHPDATAPWSYTITFGENGSGKHFNAGEELNTDDNVMMMIPQTITDNNAKISLTYVEGNTDKTISTSLKGIRWEEGKLVTYTLHKDNRLNYIYFDLSAGNVSIDNSSYSGMVYVNGEAKPVMGVHSDANRYYVYQSSSSTETAFASFNSSNTGYATEADYNNKVNCRIPAYPNVTLEDGTLWSDFIINNTSVEDVIEIWDDGKNIRTDGTSAPDEKHIGRARVRDAGRTHTRHYIKISGVNAKYNLTIDNIYSVIQVPVTNSGDFRRRDKGGIAYIPEGGTELEVNFIGDNRMGCLHINNNTSDKITLNGTGTLTVADADFLTVSEATYSTTDYGDSKGYISNFWNSAIGNNTDDAPNGEKVYNLYIDGGIVYAGATKAEDCTAIGAGGNGFGQVYINGGIVTAVATTAGTAIGGGMGHTSHGGPGEVHISGGNIYAYNFANRWGISSSAIGGGGSNSAVGSDGKVNISGGNVYAYSELGTGIGGGSSMAQRGGNAEINITGGYIIAKSGTSNGIGGGNGGSNGYTDGGTAKITISGNPIIRTGSIGGGKTLSATGHIGSANIGISGGDIQAQFVMAAGAATKPVFSMTGGTIRNSYSNDGEYIHVQKNGGAVYMDDGTFTMSGGTINNCMAVLGGAIYIKGSSATSFTMTGGIIDDCISQEHGGAVYMEGGSVTLSGGEVTNNLAQKGNGGGIYIKGGDFNMPVGGKASIARNAASSLNSQGNGSGGGIYITSTSSNLNVNILQGEIINNTSDRYGGGLSVDLGTATGVSAVVNVGAEGSTSDTDPLISGNRTSLKGGGLYVKGDKANIIINGGKILDNRTSGYVSNPDVANEGGMVTLNGGNVTHQVVTYMPNGGEINGDGSITSVSQKIVTATNSRMVVPGTFARTGWALTGWHTRPDGDDTKGKFYTTGEILNISSDLTLYAQWSETTN